MKKIIINQLHYFNWATFFIARATFMVNIMILFKLFELRPVWYFILGFGGLVLIQLTGYVLDRFGIIDDFNKRINRGVIKGMKE